MSVQAWFSNDELEIEPGETVHLKLSVQNLAESTQNYTIVPSGLTANWVTVHRANVTLFAGSNDVIDVEISPPQLPSTTAGPSVVGVRVIPSDHPDETVVAETTLDVRAFDDRRIVSLQPVIRARHRADFEFMVENHGNGLASCRMRLIDPSNRVDGRFDPPAVGVAPAGASLVRLKAKARRGVFRRTARTLEFEVEAEQPGHDPASTSLSIVQPPTIPGAAIGRRAALAALVGAVVFAWFGVVRPEIRDAAADRVDQRLERFEATADELRELGDETVPTTTILVEDESGPDADEGEPAFERLTVTPDFTETASEAFTVPDGQLFDLSELRVENRNNDAGIAALAINGVDAFTWNLANIRGSVFEPSLVPIRLEPGDNVTFTVTCATVGNPASGSCVNAVNIGGRTIEIDEI